MSGRSRPAEWSIRKLLLELRPSELWSLMGAAVVVVMGAFALGVFTDSYKGRTSESTEGMAQAFEAYRKVVEQNVELQKQLDELRKQPETERLQAEKRGLEDRITMLETQQADLRQKGGVIFSRILVFEEPRDLAGTGQLDFVRLAEEGLTVESYHYIPELRRVRRGASRDGLLLPAFSVGQEICQGARCKKVIEAYPGLIPVYHVEQSGTEEGLWLESNLNPGQKWMNREREASGIFRAMVSKGDRTAP